MFTGLVTDVGTVRQAQARTGLSVFEVEKRITRWTASAMGALIMHSGVCLTVCRHGPG